MQAFDEAIPTPRWSVSLRAPDSQQLTAADSRLSRRRRNGSGLERRTRRPAK